jgi:hypothetical protein
MVSSTSDATATARGRRRRSPVLVTGVVVVVLAVVVLGGLWLLGQQRASAAAQADLDDALERLGSAAAELDQRVVSARDLIASADGRVDPQVQDEFTTLVDDAAALDTSAPTDGSVAERAAEADRRTDRARERFAAIDSGSKDVLEGSYYWELAAEVEVYEAALVAVDQAVAAGEQAYTAGSGAPAARGALRAALDAAVVARATPVTDPEDIDRVIAVRRGVDDARAAVEAAVAGVGG